MASCAARTTRRCLMQRRVFSTSTRTDSRTQTTDTHIHTDTNTSCPPPPPPPLTGYARLTNRGLIAIAGPDSTAFLQGLVTQNMLATDSSSSSRAARRTGCYAAFLNSHGRMLHDVFIYPDPAGQQQQEPAWLVEVDRAEIPQFMKHLRKHKLRSKLTLRALDADERTVWSAWRDGDGDGRGEVASLVDGTEAAAGVAACTDTRAPGLGARVVTPGGGTDAAHVCALMARWDGETRTQSQSQMQQAQETSLASYTVRRMLHGVAEGQAEIMRESALPLECNLDLMRGVDFRKGCYVGQELTIRTHHTGIVRKRILPVQLYSAGDASSPSPSHGYLNTHMHTPVYNPGASMASALAPGSSISKLSVGGGGPRRARSAGTFLGGVGNIGLALCRLEVMTDLDLGGGVGGRAEDAAAVEFKISTDADADADAGDEVRVRAVVPPWMRRLLLSQARA